MKLSAYIDRIAFNGSLDADLPTLNALHRAHLEAIPFENIDVMLERPLTMSVEEAFDKLVTRRRGGWCYEMNGLFGWALEQVGFQVSRISAGVRRARRGDAMLGNHLALMVRLDRDYLVDVGFGGAQTAAIPLAEGTTNHPPIQITLGRIEEGYWRLFEGGPGAASSYDFQPNVCDEARLQESFRFQITSPDSIFRQRLSIGRRSGKQWVRLRGLVLETLRPGNSSRVVLDSPNALLEGLKAGFDLNEPEIADLWPQLWDAHKALFPHGW